jgi:hypothetical protein
MPHRCTDCGHTFPDGSKEMLSGCPDCGGNTFQYLPESTTREAEPVESAPPGDPAKDDPTKPESAGVPSEPEGSTAAADAEARTDAETGTDAEAGANAETGADAGVGAEDRAQADARSSFVDASELPKSRRESEPESVPERDPEPEDEDDDPDLSELREELNDQFESIRIVDHGQYELNLMELYKREEFIIALQENGRYVIEVPESLRRGPDE